jgi:hypothetical protein
MRSQNILSPENKFLKPCQPTSIATPAALAT